MPLAASDLWTAAFFDDEVNLEFYMDETRRYYSNIVGKYGLMVQKALKKNK